MHSTCKCVRSNFPNRRVICQRFKPCSNRYSSARLDSRKSVVLVCFQRVYDRRQSVWRQCERISVNVSMLAVLSYVQFWYIATITSNSNQRLAFQTIATQFKRNVSGQNLTEAAFKSHPLELNRIVVAFKPL
jgi:hypothetical protein